MYTFTGFHNVLGLKYVKTFGGIIFEDGVIYSNDETEILKSIKPDLKLMHQMKKIFKGEIIYEE